MRILEIGEYRYFSNYAPAITDFYSPHKAASPETRLSLRQLLVLRKRLKTGGYDLVVYHVGAKVLAPWHRHHSLGRIAYEIVTSSLASFHKLSWHCFHYLLSGTTTPLVVIDAQDAPRITKTESVWLDRCQFWFMRELPPNRMNLFLNMDRRCSEAVNILRQKPLRRNFVKIRPFSLGFDLGEIPSAKADPEAKIYDVFSGCINDDLTVRQRGLEELKALQATGLRIYIPEGRLSKAEFYRACAQSWLVLSPEGLGWDCHRHYEALMLHSVPLINTPTIERLWPFRSGEHCLYYPPEKGGLTEVIQSALQDRDALLKIAGQGRAYILQHHTRSQLVRHVLSRVGLLEKGGPHILDR